MSDNELIKFIHTQTDVTEEYKKSKEKYPPFRSLKQAWKTLKREYCEVKNEMLREEIISAKLRAELIQIANVAIQFAMMIENKEGGAK